MTSTRRHLVVVSFYAPRPTVPLVRLLTAVRGTPAGAEFDVALVINRDNGAGAALVDWTDQVHRLADVVLERPNTGMNIGAWDFGWRTLKAYDGYLFLQDDCILKATDWLNAFVKAAADPSIGLVGESWNSGWDRPWHVMRKSVAKHALREHLINNRPANRVDLYLDFMQRHGVNPGDGGGHLRALSWFARRETLLAINGFLHGANYGECIAAEIAATKQVQAIGLRAVQLAGQPFACFGHADWAQLPDGRWQHV
ncbi:hypothetical protein [Polaromonas sp. YR568]|uniref:hypothetical protein n=1 Tax=Polaromonas sp. YR568 TaxID=1855301 RepID=UPI003137B4D9